MGVFGGIAAKHTFCQTAQSAANDERCRPGLSATSQTAGKVKAYGTDVKQLVAADGYTIYGNNGGFAVIANDDVVPALLGYSHTAYNTNVTNPNFKSWLDAVNQMVQLRPRREHPWCVPPSPTPVSMPRL